LCVVGFEIVPIDRTISKGIVSMSKIASNNKQRGMTKIGRQSEVTTSFSLGV